MKNSVIIVISAFIVYLIDLGYSSKSFDAFQISESPIISQKQYTIHEFKQSITNSNSKPFDVCFTCKCPSNFIKICKRRTEKCTCFFNEKYYEKYIGKWTKPELDIPNKDDVTTLIDTGENDNSNMEEFLWPDDELSQPNENFVTTLIEILKPGEWTETEVNNPNIDDVTGLGESEYDYSKLKEFLLPELELDKLPGKEPMQVQLWKAPQLTEDQPTYEPDAKFIDKTLRIRPNNSKHNDFSNWASDIYKTYEIE